MATIVRPAKGKKVVADRIRFDHTLLGDMKEPCISGVFCSWRKAASGRKQTFSMHSLSTFLVSLGRITAAAIAKFT
jgi:hypothetical protein